MENRIAPLDFAQDFLKEFDQLYDKYLKERFEPALENLTRALTALLDDKFPPSQRMRLHLDPGRIKSPNRLLLKAQTSKYRPLVNSPSDIFRVIPDIVGTRVTINTLSDVYAVVDTIKACATNDNPARTLFKLNDDWEDDYIKSPKESGYRAINLIVGVPVPLGALMEPITCEIQIRTLLQHAWGELTHEDTYKPGVKVPELVQVLSKRLATALAVLDEIAQDLRNELDKLERPELQVEVPAGTLTPAAKEATSEQPPGPGLAPMQQEFPSELVPAPTGGERVEEAPVPSKEDLTQAFQEAFDRDPMIEEIAVDKILTELRAAGLYRAKEIATVLAESREAVQELESQYEKVSLTDLGLLRAAIQFRVSTEKGTAWVKEVLQRAATKGRFKTAYPEGRETLGSVVYVTWNYALIQLPEGDTGILHVSGMKAFPEEYITVGDLVQTGDTVRVRILKVDPDSKRIELQLIR